MCSDSGSLLDIGGIKCGLIGRKKLGACSLDVPYGRLWVQSNADGLGDGVIERLVHFGALVTKDVPVTVSAHLPDGPTEVGAYVHSGNVIRGEVGVLRDLVQASLEGGALGVEFLGGGRISVLTEGSQYVRSEAGGYCERHWPRARGWRSPRWSLSARQHEHWELTALRVRALRR